MEPGSLVMLVVLLGVSYFMLIRPQKKRMAEHNKLLASLAPGDEVVTIGGIYGFVNQLEDDTVWLEVSEGIEMRFSRSAVSRKITEGESEEAVEEEAAEPEVEPEAAPADADPSST